MRMIWRGHCLTCERGAKNEVRFINSPFGIAVIERCQDSGKVRLQQLNATEPIDRVSVLVDSSV